MRISVIGGSGYVGFITGLGFAELGNDVVNVDIAADKVSMMNGGKSPIYEEGVDLDDVLRRNLEVGRIRFTTDLEEGMRHGEVVFVAVGTPQRTDGEADLSQVIGVAEEIGQYLNEYKVLVMKSTVPVGTLDIVCSIIKRTRREGEEFDVASNPEFLREGKGLYDFFHPSRIVVGTSAERARAMLRDLYGPFLVAKAQGSSQPTSGYAPRPSTPLLETDIASAQMIKYASNAFLATRVSFVNEIASVCESVGANVLDVVQGMGYDERIGAHYLNPGPGFGGPCLEKDIKALIALASNYGYDAAFLRSVLRRNEAQLESILQRVKALAGYPLYRKKIALLGLAFKAGTNDVRTSLSVRILDELVRQGVDVAAHDPVAMEEARAIYPEVAYHADVYGAAEGASVLVLMTEWPEYMELDFREIAGRMDSPNIVDTRNLLDPALLRRIGFKYVGMGVAS